MVRTEVSKVRDTLSGTIDRLVFQGEHVIFQLHEENEAALIPVTDLWRHSR